MFTDTHKIKNWEINYSESDQWEFYHTEKNDHFLYVGAAEKQRDHEWFAIPYIGEMTADHYESDDRRNFHSLSDTFDWVDSYLDNHPHGHDPNELHH
ncbi:hypothetical protein HTG_13515 [Natrinema mahii]|nr:hypothetical protein HTG_13515 [Natrinema mahii]